jgi:predicted dehydrogenase
MKYFRGPVAVKQIINSGDLGKILAVNYQTGQYLPDWHPWEPPQDFYVSKRETGGCREIVPFELTWLNDIFGAPTPIFCYKSKISNFDFDIDDIYQIVLKYPKGELVNIVIEVLSRPFASRMLYVIGSDGQLMFDGEKSIVRYATIDDPRWHELDVSESNNFQDSINPEGPYVRETSDFITAVATRNASVFPNSLSKDAEILTTLYELERLAERRGAAM